MLNSVWFDEPNHKYYNVLNKEYISVTTLIGQYKKKKDWYAIASKYAIKNGRTAEYWLGVWEDIKEKACRIGSDFHAVQEAKSITGGNGVEIHNDIELKVDTGLIPLTIDNPLYLEDKVYPEIRVWHHGYCIAGTVDKFIKFDGKYFDIDDYKTNKKIDRESFYNSRTGKYDMMEKPINHLMDCSLIHYELQLSLYAFILESYGLVCKNIGFTHHPKGEDNVIATKGIRYNVNYKERKKDVELMLKDRLKQLK